MKEPAHDEVADRLLILVEEAKQEVTQVAKETSDRGCILLGAAMIERRLKRTIDARIATAKPEQTRKALGGHSLGKLITIGAALGIVPETWIPNLKLIAKIRNEAAHQIEASSFSVPTIKSSCAQLQEPNADTTRDQYLWTVSHYCLRLDQVHAIVTRIEGLTIVETPAIHSASMKLAMVLTRPGVAAMVANLEEE